MMSRQSSRLWFLLMLVIMVRCTEWDVLVDHHYPKTCSRDNLFGDSRSGQIAVNMPPKVTQTEAFIYVQQGQKLAKNMEAMDLSSSSSWESFPSLAMQHFFSSRISPDIRAASAASKANLLGARVMQNKKSSCGGMTPNTFISFLESGNLRGSPGLRQPVCLGLCRGCKGAPLDGACNNLLRPQWGAAMQAFTRIAPHNYADGLYSMPVSKSGRPLPSPRLLSSSLMTGPPSTSRFFTAMSIYWGQIIAHDLSMRVMEQHGSGGGIQCCSTDGSYQLSGSKFHPACAPIEVGPFDPFYSQFGVRYLNFVRTITAPNRQNTLGPAEQLNSVSSFLDCSPVYGYNTASAYNLREHYGGLLKLTEMNKLPQAPDASVICDTSQGNCPCFMTGDTRSNQTPGLAALQTLLAREHNRLARALAALNAHWSDERLYQEARRILIAQVQHITYCEWLPLFIGKGYSRNFNILPMGLYSFDYNPDINAGIINSFAAGAFRFFHTMVPGEIVVMPEGNQQQYEIRLSEQYLRPCILGHFSNAVEGVVRGAVNQPAMEADTSFTPEITNLLFKAQNSWGLDLVAFDIQRGRDHGLSSYNTFRSICGLRKANDFDDLAGEIPLERIASLKRIYECVDDIDLFVGGMMESGVYGSLLGPTFQSIVGEQFYRTRVGDRFFYDVGDMPHSFTPDQLREIKKSSTARLICDNSNIHEIQANAFQLPCHSNPLVSSLDTQHLPSIDLRLWKEN